MYEWETMKGGDLKDLIYVLTCYETFFCKRAAPTLTNFCYANQTSVKLDPDEPFALVSGLGSGVRRF